MLHVREFNTADALMAHYKDLKARQRNVRIMVPVPEVAEGVKIYPEPIGPNQPFMVRMIHRTEAERREAATITKARILVHDICDEFSINWNEFISRRRNQYLIKARRKGYWTLKTETSWSLPQIGDFVHKDHTTVMHGIRRYELDLIHQQEGLPLSTTKEFRVFEKCGCRKTPYLIARERAL